jgi:hypothetical protein
MSTPEAHLAVCGRDERWRRDLQELGPAALYRLALSSRLGAEPLDANDVMSSSQDVFVNLLEPLAHRVVYAFSIIVVASTLLGYLG